MTRNDFMALVLHATEDTLDLLESALRHDQQDDLRDPLSDPAANTVLLATDQLAFALARYRVEHAIPQR